MKSKTYLFFLVIILVSGAEHYPIFNRELVGFHVWRQTETQSNIINFYEEDMNILHPRRNDRGSGDGIYRQEFPLMQWLTALLYKIFGNHLIITRIFMFIIGLFTLYGMYLFLLFLSGNRIIAITGTWAFNFSPVFYYYTVNPLPDNLALCFSVWGIALFLKWVRTSSFHLLPASGFLLGLGALCKLPYILYAVLPATFFIRILLKNGFRKDFYLPAASLLVFLLLPVPWYLYASPDLKGNGIIAGMLHNTLPWSTIGSYFLFHLVSSLPETLINYGSLLFFLAGLYFQLRRKTFRHPLFYPVLFWGISILFYFAYEINMIGKVHDYYLLPFLPLLFIPVGYGAFHLLKNPSAFLRYLSLFLLLILPVTAYLRMQSRWDTDHPGFNRDLLLYKTELRKAVPQKALVVAGNDISHYIFFYYIDKKGWEFDHNQLDGKRLQEMIRQGARYLYSDSRAVDEDPGIRPFLDTLITEKGSVRVYKLRTGNGKHGSPG